MEEEELIRECSLQLVYDNKKIDSFIYIQRDGKARFLLLNNKYYPIKFFLPVKIHPSKKDELGMEEKYYEEEFKKKSYSPRNGMFIILQNPVTTEKLGKIQNLRFIEEVKKAA